MKNNEKLNFNVGKNINGEEIKLTKEGYEKRQERLRELINDIRPKILVELSEARQQGDLSENADYDSAKNKQSQIENEISTLEALLTKAVVIEEVDNESIQLGTKVCYLDIELNEKKTIKIVDPAEVDPTNNPPLVGYKSPLSSALLGGKPGEIKEVKTPKREYKIKILDLL